MEGPICKCGKSGPHTCYAWKYEPSQVLDAVDGSGPVRLRGQFETLRGERYYKIERAGRSTVEKAAILENESKFKLQATRWRPEEKP